MEPDFEPFDREEHLPRGKVSLGKNLVAVVPVAQVTLNNLVVPDLAPEFSPAVGGNVRDVHKGRIVVDELLDRSSKGFPGLVF